MFLLSPLVVKGKWESSFTRYRLKPMICALTSKIWAIGYRRVTPDYFLLHVFFFRLDEEPDIEDDSSFEDFVGSLFEEKPFRVYSTGAILKKPSYPFK